MLFNASSAFSINLNQNTEATETAVADVTLPADAATTSLATADPVSALASASAAPSEASSNSDSESQNSDNDGDYDDDSFVQVPNPDRRLVLSAPLRTTSSEITLEHTLNGRELESRTYRLFPRAKKLFVDRWPENQPFFKMSGEAAPFKCSSCQKASRFTTCVVSPFYRTDTNPLACANCYMRREAGTCEHNPARGRPHEHDRELRCLLGAEYALQVGAAAAEANPPPINELITPGVMANLQASGYVVLPAARVPRPHVRFKRAAAIECNRRVKEIATTGMAPKDMGVAAPAAIEPQPKGDDGSDEESKDDEEVPGGC
ncbi:hypothetical protein KEM56_001881 [Ascosphaera pollenicola]|nr:hypothetical protein KEM56_001881 [Ascosphaera pollenicola]